MTASDHPPLSGYSVLKVYSTEQLLTVKKPDEDDSNHDGIQFGWDWRWIEPRVFEIRITMAVEPSAERHQYVATNVIGRFRQVDDAPRIPVSDFASLQAVAILLPYARQFISTLTGNAFLGAYYLPTMNVVSLMEGFDPLKATAVSQESAARGVPAIEPGAGATGHAKRIRKVTNKKK